MSTTRKLTIELVPKPCWEISLKRLMPATGWDSVRRRAYREANYHCTICGTEGRMNAHEQWVYDDTTHTQRLIGITAICDMCHHVKHLGHAGIMAEEGTLNMADVIAHYCAVNGCTEQEFERDSNVAFFQWATRNKHTWATDFGAYLRLVPPANRTHESEPTLW